MEQKYFMLIKKRWFAVALLAILLVLLVQQLRASRMDALLYQGLEINDAAAVSVTAGDGPARGIPSAQWREITVGSVQMYQNEAAQQVRRMDGRQLAITLQSGETVAAVPGEWGEKPAVVTGAYAYVFEDGSLALLQQACAAGAEEETAA